MSTSKPLPDKHSRCVLSFLYFFFLSVTVAQATITDYQKLLSPQEIETLENIKFDLYQSHKIHTQIFTYDSEQYKKQAIQSWQKRRLNKARASILILVHTDKANGMTLYFNEGIIKIDPDFAVNTLNKSATRINRTTTTTFLALQKFLDTIPDDLRFLIENATTKANDLETEITYQKNESDQRAASAVKIALALLALLLLIGLACILYSRLKKQLPYQFPLVHHQPRLGATLAGGTSALITKDKARTR